MYVYRHMHSVCTCIYTYMLCEYLLYLSCVYESFAIFWVLCMYEDWLYLSTVMYIAVENVNLLLVYYQLIMLGWISMEQSWCCQCRAGSCPFLAHCVVLSEYIWPIHFNPIVYHGIIPFQSLRIMVYDLWPDAWLAPDRCLYLTMIIYPMKFAICVVLKWRYMRPIWVPYAGLYNWMAWCRTEVSPVR